ncbi:MAG: Uma2 family endonuclease [Chloroflexota bacterium]
MAIETTPAVEVRKKLTPDDVCRMQLSGELRDKAHEPVDGELIEVPPTIGEHGKHAGNLAGPLWAFAQHAGGRIFDSSTGFMVSPGHRQLRSPDVSYIGPARLRASYPCFIDGAPDLAVEILSEGQHGEAYAKTKVLEYFEASAQLVWFVDLAHREVRVYRPESDEITILRRDAVLTLEPIVSGFVLKVEDIFS